MCVCTHTHSLLDRTRSLKLAGCAWNNKQPTNLHPCHTRNSIHLLTESNPRVLCVLYNSRMYVCMCCINVSFSFWCRTACRVSCVPCLGELIYAAPTTRTTPPPPTTLTRTLRNFVEWAKFNPQTFLSKHTYVRTTEFSAKVDGVGCTCAMLQCIANDGCWLVLVVLPFAEQQGRPRCRWMVCFACQLLW